MSEIYEDADAESRDRLDVQLGSSEGDDEPVTPPDMQPRATEWGTTAYEQGQEETIDQRIAQEVPDPDSAYGAPDNESGLDGPGPVGGDDPDAIDADQDFLGDPSLVDADEVGDVDDDLGELVADDEGARQDTDGAAWAQDVGGSGSSPEESAMHVVEDD